MAAGAKPALDPSITHKTEEAPQEPETKATSLKDRIIHKLTKIFEHNERLGVTRF